MNHSHVKWLSSSTMYHHATAEFNYLTDSKAKKSIHRSSYLQVTHVTISKNFSAHLKIALQLSAVTAVSCCC